jgi:secondary thiamine-phosphate synthase enzyme
MKNYYQELGVVSRRREEFIDVTAGLQDALTASGATEGVLLAQVMHTTAGLTINENADPDVVQDLLAQLKRLASRDDYRHGEGNSDAHVKSSLVGASIQVPVHQGRLALGTWQGVYFCEFDGPRPRKIAVRIIGA